MKHHLCVRCKQLIGPTNRHKKFCSKRCRVAWNTQQWRNRSGPKYLQHLKKNCIRSKRLRKTAPKIPAAYHRNYRVKLKSAVFAAYGGSVCACCGETIIQFLSLDHIVPRVKGSPTGIALYKHLRQRGYPPGYQVLCMNCNFGKKRNALCPHKTLISTLEDTGQDVPA